MNKKKKQQFVIILVVGLISMILMIKFIAYKNNDDKNNLKTKSSEITTKIEELTEDKFLSEEEFFEDKPEGVIIDGKEVFYEEDTPLNDFFNKQLKWMEADEEGDI